MDIPIFGDRVEFYKNLNSTQDRVKEIFKSSPVKALVVAESQQAGYGRRGSKWESPEGGLYFSVLTKYSGQNKNLLSIYALLASLKAFKDRDTINSVPIVECKWPNDIIIKGKKAGGIITESFKDGWVAFGVGINTSLSVENFKQYIRDEVSVCNVAKFGFINSFIHHLDKYFVSDEMDGGLSAEDMDLINKRHFLNNKIVRVNPVRNNVEKKTIDGNREGLLNKGVSNGVNEIEGRVLGIDPQGRLKIKTGGMSAGGIKKIEYGTVVLVKKQRDTINSVPIICIDVGNTFTRIGKTTPRGFKTVNIPTRPHDDFVLRLMKNIKAVAGSSLNKVEGAAVSCVVGAVQEKLVKAVGKEISCKVINVTDKTTAGLKLKVSNPAQIGADRICNAVAAYNFYGGNIVIVDLGTANTYDIVSSSGEYSGGVIAPGIETMAESLIKKADGLDNRYLFKLPRKIIGDETSACLNSGLYLTLKGQVETTLKAIKNEWKKEFKVILTGGAIEWIDMDVRDTINNVPCIVDRDITLKGLALIWMDESEKKSIKKGTKAESSKGTKEGN